MISDLQNEIILPCSPFYNTARQEYNRSIQKYPAAIVYCSSTDDVARAIHFAKENNFTLRVRSGGHNYEGFSSGDGAIVIDISKIKGAAIDTDNNTVLIGGGVTNQELYGFLAGYGYPFPSGTCPTVGASGLTQGGGWGHSARLFGLTCDSLVEAELVDARGDLITANSHSHPQLFWALRGGGGGNFGVVVSLKYRLPPKLFNVTYVDIRYFDVPEKTAEQFFGVWQTWLKTANNLFTPNSRIFNSAEDGRGIFLRGFYYGSSEEARKEIEPFLSIPGAAASFREVTFYEATQIDASFYPPFELFRFAGRFAHGEFSHEQIKNIVQLIQKRAKGSTFASVALYALGGRVQDIAPRDTAFFYRNADYIIGLETVWEDPKAKCPNLHWLFPRVQYLESVTCGSYINFPYLGTHNYMQAYYGGNAGDLVTVKRRYDPCNLFCFPQSIRP